MLAAATRTLDAVEELRRLILSGDLPPGSNHFEVELAERLGLSRTPLREAALRLEAQGLVEVQPRRGIRITALSPEDMDEIYEILTELEGIAITRAMRHGVTDQDLNRLNVTITQMEKALQAEDREAWAEADSAFHATLIELARSPRLTRMVATFNDQVSRARSQTLWLRPLPTASLRDHKAVVTAMADGNAVAARSLHTGHRDAAREMMVELIEKHRLRAL